MISSIRLENWKAYDRLDLELRAGTTFVVAQNGVGKSSLLQGAMWTVFGDAALPFPAADAVRGEARFASGSVRLHLPDGSDVRVTRRVSLSETGRTKEQVAYQLGGSQEEASRGFERLLERSCGIDPEFLARLLVLNESAVAEEIDPDKRFSLHDYLSSMFGTQSLRSTSESMRLLALRLAKEGDQIRRVDEADLQQTMRTRASALEGLDRATAELIDRRSALQQESEQLRAEEALASEWATFDRSQTELATAREAVARDAEHLLHPGTAADPVHERLATARDYSREEANRLRSSAALLQAELELIGRYVQMLDEAEGDCPVCRRNLDADTQLTAQHSHLADQSATETQLRTVREELEAVTREHNELERLLTKLTVLPTPSRPSNDRPRDRGDERSQRLARLENEVLELSERIGAIRREDKELTVAQEADERALQNNQAAIRIYRSSEIAQAVHLSTQHALDRIQTTQVGPLHDELTMRWKDLWPDQRGLVLTSEGTLAFARGSRLIKYEQFSGAEKALSLVALRLLLVQMSSSLRMLWLDEPLEHLDPRNRRVLASLLTSATAQRALDQVVVTTYEEPVVRRISERTSGNTCDVVYIRSDLATE